MCCRHRLQISSCVFIFQTHVNIYRRGVNYTCQASVSQVQEAPQPGLEPVPLQACFVVCKACCASAHEAVRCSSTLKIRHMQQAAQVEAPGSRCT